ncbi:MAG: PIN domain-containing protein [Ginsengibacter sp.]
MDTAPLIYFIEGNSEYQEKLENLFRLNDEGYFKFLTSSITLLEVLVKPLRDGETKIVEQYKTILRNAEGIDIFDITATIAIRAAEIRAKYNSRTPDALQVATAIVRNADYILTNDVRLKAITEIKVITIADFK